MTSVDLDILIAKDAIRDVLHTYAQAADRGDLERLAQCYHPDAIDKRDYNDDTSVESFLSTLTHKLAIVQFVQHHVSNVLIKVDGDYAESECFVFTRALMKGDSPVFYQSMARYLDKFERREGVWRIAHRRVVSTWARTVDDPVNEVIERRAPEHMVSRIGATDPSYAFFRLFGRGRR